MAMMRNHPVQTDGRLRKYVIDPQTLLVFLNCTANWPQYMVVTSGNSLPDGAELVDLFYDVHCRSLFVVVWHPGFEVVPEGAELPLGPGIVEQTCTYLERQEDGSYRIPPPLNVTGPWSESDPARPNDQAQPVTNE